MVPSRSGSETDGAGLTAPFALAATPFPDGLAAACGDGVFGVGGTARIGIDGFAAIPAAADTGGGRSEH